MPRTFLGYLKDYKNYVISQANLSEGCSKLLKAGASKMATIVLLNQLYIFMFLNQYQCKIAYS